MPSNDEIRDVQRATWAGLSPAWTKWDSVIMDQLGTVGAAIIERLDIADDQQHLDIATGTGEPGLTVAELAPRGHVVLTDLAVEMLDIATRRANAQGIGTRPPGPAAASITPKPRSTDQSQGMSASCIADHTMAWDGTPVIFTIRPRFEAEHADPHSCIERSRHPA